MKPSRWKGSQALALGAWLLGLAALALATASDEPARKATPLSLRQYLALVLDRNLGLKITHEGRVVRAAAVEEARGGFDPAFTGRGTKGETRTPFFNTSPFSGFGLGFTRARTRNLSMSYGLSQKFYSGTVLDVTWGMDRTRNANRFSLNPTYQPKLTLTLSQPLLKGGWFSGNRVALQVARKQHQAANLDYRRQVSAVLAQAHTVYWRLVAAGQDVQVQDLALKQAQDLVAINRAKFQAGTITELELTVAQAGEAQQQEQVILVRNRLRDGRDALVQLIVGDAAEVALKEELEPSDELDLVEVEADAAASMKRALERREDIRSAALDVKIAQLQLEQARNARWPQLDLTSSYDQTGLGRGAGSSQERWETGQFYDWSLGLVLRVPVGNRQPRASFRKAMSGLRSAELGLKQKEVALAVEVRQAVRKVQAARERVAVSRVGEELSRKKLAQQQTLFEVGKVTSHDVLEFQSDLAKASAAATRALVDFRIAVVELHQAEGMLLEHDQIELR